jgi:hypothetical protein
MGLSARGARLLKQPGAKLFVRLELRFTPAAGVARKVTSGPIRIKP